MVEEGYASDSEFISGHHSGSDLSDVALAAKLPVPSDSLTSSEQSNTPRGRLSVSSCDAHMSLVSNSSSENEQNVADDHKIHQLLLECF